MLAWQEVIKTMNKLWHLPFFTLFFNNLFFHSGQLSKVPAALFLNGDAEEALECIYPNFVSSLNVDLQKNLNLEGNLECVSNHKKLKRLTL